MKIIIADDDSAIRGVYRDVICSLSKNIEVDMVENGEDLVKKVRQNNYDLVITDNSMGPGIKGLEAIKEIRKFNQKVPICLASGDNIEDVAFDAGASVYLPKPAMFETLENAIRRYLAI